MLPLVLLVLLGGCHKLFGLEAVNDEPQDVGVGIDASIDAKTVTCPVDPVEFDEDKDGIDDRCDGCPTVGGDDVDTDFDELPEECDINLASFDKLLFAATFAQQIDLTAFESTGITWRPGADGTVSFARGAMLRTKEMYKATRVEVRLSEVEGDTANAAGGMLAFGTTTVTCELQTKSCDGASDSAMCLKFGTGVSDLGASSSTLRILDMFRTSTMTVCTATSSSNIVGQVSDNLPLGEAQIQLTTNAAATAVVQSIVIYGAGD